MTRGTRFESRVLVQSDYALSEIAPLALLIRCSPRVYICTCAPYAWLADAADAAAAKSAYLRTHPSTRLSHAHAIPACQLYISPNPQTVETGTSLRVDGEARTLTEGRLGLLSKIEALGTSGQAAKDPLAVTTGEHVCTGTAPDAALCHPARAGASVRAREPHRRAVAQGHLGLRRALRHRTRHGSDVRLQSRATGRCMGPGYQWRRRRDRDESSYSSLRAARERSYTCFCRRRDAHPAEERVGVPAS